MEVWEFIRSPAGVRECWRWRQKDRRHNVFRESSCFMLFMECLQDACSHGFDVGTDTFQLVEE